MKSGFTTLTDFAKEIERIESAKEDYVVPFAKLRMVNDEELSFSDGNIKLTDYAHGQLASKMGIPKRYYDDMSQISGLRATNVNSWIDHNKDSYLVRTIDNKARAILSSRYRIIDNFPILKDAIFPVLQEYKNDLQVKSYSITDTKMYLQLIFPSISAEVAKGDVLNYGVTITNSEVGAGAFDIKSFFWRLVCSNGLISESLIRRNHIGRSVDYNSDEAQIYKDDTIEAETEAYKLKIRDVIDYSLKDTQKIRSLAEKVSGAIEQKVESPLVDVIKNVTKRYSGIILESDSDKIIKTVIMEQQHNKWGLVNGITALAQDISNTDRAYQLEKAGYDLLNASNTEWRRIA